MTAWRCVGFCRGSAAGFFGGGRLARWRIAAIMAKASITREIRMCDWCQTRPTSRVAPAQDRKIEIGIICFSWFGREPEFRAAFLLTSVKVLWRNI
jgi:hypothetical protein